MTDHLAMTAFRNSGLALSTHFCYFYFLNMGIRRPVMHALACSTTIHKSDGILPNMAINQMTPLRHITVERAIINQMLGTMREFGSHGWEVLVLWVGEIELNTGEARVTQAYVPKQKAISNEDGVGYFVGGETLFQLNRELSETGLRLIAQVHSHPREAYHSEADDRYAIVTAEGGLSLVVPDFGSAPAEPASWAVYRLHGRDWRELGPKEVGSLFDVVGDQ